MKHAFLSLCSKLCLTVVCTYFSNSYTSQTIETLAGTGIAGYVDLVPAINAQLNHPRGIDVDVFGNIYIADTENHRIRKIDINCGIISTIAGNGTIGFSDDMPAINAMLNYPTDVAVDTAGNIFIADNQNHRIRKVSSITGEITTIAGTGVAGYNSETLAINATLNSPEAIAVDLEGNIYIADDLNSLLRKIDAITGEISTIGGGGSDPWSNGIPAVNALILNPKGIAVDNEGNIYFSQVTHDRLRKISVSTGEINTIAGTTTEGFSGDGGPATQAELSEPLGLIVDSDFNVYYADKNPLRIRMISASDFTIQTVAGTGNSGPYADGGLAIETNLNNSTGVAIDHNGCLLIAEYGDSRIRRIECCSQLGYMDPLASNFNPEADCSDASCEYTLFGCTYPLASNYNSSAQVDDGSCLFLGCTDPDAENFNPIANFDDGSCSYLPCGTDSDCPADLNNDNLVSVSDLIIFIGIYGSVCP